MSAQSSGFKLDIDRIRKQARSHVEQGAVTSGYEGERKVIVELLNASLATELVCMLRYRRHHFMSAQLGGIQGFSITQELLTHANEELAHADLLAQRIMQLGGEPDFSPKTLTERSHADYAVGKDLPSMLVEDLVAERIAIDAYGEMIRFIGDKDPTTRRMLEQILEQEEEHADELADFLERRRRH